MAAIFLIPDHAAVFNRATDNDMEIDLRGPDNEIRESCLACVRARREICA